MKGLILCAGVGTRLRPLTHTGAKHLIPVANKPILFYTIEDLVSSGITDIGLVVGGATRSQIEETVGDGAHLGARVTYVPQHKPLGLGHAIAVAQDYVGDSRFVVYLGDNIIHGGTQAFVKGFPEDADAQVLLAKVQDPNRFGVAVVDGDRVVRLVEKPVSRISDLAIVGVYGFTPAIFGAIERTKPSARGEVEITDAIQWLVAQQRHVKAHFITDWWMDTGRPRDVLEANRLLLMEMQPRIEGDVDSQSDIVGDVSLGRGTLVRSSQLRGPISIGANCVIDRCYVGPYTSIGDRCELRNTEIEFSIVLREAKILDMPHRIDSSLIGSAVSLARRKSPANTVSFVLGDESRMEIS